MKADRTDVSEHTFSPIGAVRAIPRPVIPAPPPSSDAVRALMSANRGADTKPELLLRAELHRRGLRFRKHYRPLAGLRCRADLAFPWLSIAVFVDGCFWHGCPAHGHRPRANGRYWREKLEGNRARDARNNELLSASGWTVIRIWEHEDLSTAADRVIRAVTCAREGA
jgi:DNA mismatch endonuclease, patch repair protein